MFSNGLKVGSLEFSVWDHITMESDCTIQEFIDELAELYNLDVLSISTSGKGSVILWAGYELIFFLLVYSHFPLAL